MGTLANLNVRLSLQASEFTRGLQDAQKSLSSWGKSMTSLGQKMTLGVTAPLAGGFALAINAASNLNEAQSAVNTVFGDSAKVINDYSKTSATALGVSQTAYLDQASSLGALFTGMGMGQKQSAAFSSNILQNASDLASFYNTDPGTVFQDLNSGLIGEAEPLRKYGILLSEAAVQQKAMEQTGKANAKQLTESEKVTARYALIQEQMGAAQGDFARTSGGLANSQRILRAQLSDTAAQMGQVLLPYVLQAVKALSGLLTWVQNLSPAMQKWAVVIGVVAAAMGPLLMILGTMLPALAALLSPIGLIVIALVAIAAVLTMAYLKNWGGFADKVNAVTSSVVEFIKTFRSMYALISKTGKYSKVTSAFRALGFAIANLTGLDPKRIVDFFTGLGKAVDRPLQAFKKMGEGLLGIGKAILSGDFRGALLQGKKFLAGFGDYLASPAKAIGQFLKGINTGIKPVDDFIHRLGGLATSFGRLTQELFQGDLSGAMDVAGRMLGQLGGLAQSAWEALKAGFAAINWSEVWSTLTSGASGALKALEGVGSDLLQGVLNGWDTHKETLKGYASGLGSWVLSQVTDAPQKLKTVGESLLNGVIAGWDAVKPTLSAYASGLAGWVLGQITDAPDKLKSIGEALLNGVLAGWDAVKPLLSSYTSGLASWVLTQITDAPDKLKPIGEALLNGVITGWDAIKPSLAAYASGLGSWVLGQIKNAATALKGVGSDLLHGVMSGWDEAGMALAAYAEGLTRWVLGYITDAGTVLNSVGSSLLQGVITGWDTIKPTLESYASGLTGWIAGLITDAPTVLFDAGSALLQGVIDGWDTIKPTLQSYASGLGQWVSNTVGDLGATLYDQGSALIQGLLDGWDSLKTSLSSYASGLGGYISGAVGDLSGTLYGAGVAVIQGLMNGISSKLGDLYNLVSGIGGEIVKRKGPLDYDRVMLQPAGEAIIGGLIRGINNQLPALYRTINEISGSLATGSRFGDGIELRYAAASRAGNGLAESAIPGIGGSNSGSMGRGSGFTNYGTIRVEAPSPEDFYQQWRQQQIGGVRR